MGVRLSSVWLLSCLIVTLSTANIVAADAACSKGDQPCFCKSIGGTWKALQAPLLPACKVTYQHQGAERYVHVYLPPSYDGTTQWPIWVHLHGVFWATMGDIGARVGHPVNGTDIIPAFDHSVEILGDKAILVYPQSTGDAGTGAADEGQGKKYRQFWSIPFWHCSVGICRDASTDDMGFIEQVVADLPKRLPLKPGHYLLTGESAGGMMVHAILCQSRSIPAMVDAAIDMLGGVGADYARGPSCATHTPIPFLKLHGIEDPFITYSKDILVDGVNFASSIEGTQLHAKANGCGDADVGAKDVSEGDGKMLCTDYCGGSPGKLPAKLCGMPGVGHDTDHPHPGFVYEQSWAWFQQQVKAAAQRRPMRLKKLPEKDAAIAKVNKCASVAAKLPPSAAMDLKITYPGAKVEDFEGEKGAAALAAVSKATGLPAANITATYATGAQAAPDAMQDNTAESSGSRSGGSRKLQRQQAATLAAADGAVTGQYSLKAADPAKVAESVVSSVRDGSLLASLRQSGLAAAAGSTQQGPLVSLMAAAAAGSTQQGPLVSLMAAAGAAAQQVVLKATDLVEAAAAAAGAPADAAATATDGGSTATSRAVDTRNAVTPPSRATATSSAAVSSSSSKPSRGVVVGVVVGAVGGLALLAGAAWAVAASHRRKQQQQQQQQQVQQQVKQMDEFDQVHSKAWDEQQQQQRPGVINLSADAAMYIADADEAPVQQRTWCAGWHQGMNPAAAAK